MIRPHETRPHFQRDEHSDPARIYWGGCELTVDLRFNSTGCESSLSSKPTVQAPRGRVNADDSGRG